jgi:ABC-type uncharacterized transport system involved in gliding motility auxiliary subunit
VELVPDKAVGDLQLASRMTWAGRGHPQAVEYPLWMTLPTQQLDGDDIVTANLASVVVATPGELRRRAGATTTLTPLVQTTAKAMAFDAARVRFLTDPQQILRDYQPGGTPFTLAARISGKTKSAFPDGPPGGKLSSQHESKDGSSAAHLAESKEPIDLIVVADTDLLTDRFWVRQQNLLGRRIVIPRAANGTFVVNALDNVAGSNDLISVRNRGQFSRPFTRVDRLREAAEVRYRQKEPELVSRLKETERKLADLERGKEGSNAMILSAAQEPELEQFRRQKVQIRKDLRQVRHDLRGEIEHLETSAKFVNIGLMPLLIALGGVVVGVQRARRRRAAAVPG